MNKYIAFMIIGSNSTVIAKGVYPDNREAEAKIVHSIAEKMTLYPHWESILVNRLAKEDEPSPKDNVVAFVKPVPLHLLQGY